MLFSKGILYVNVGHTLNCQKARQKVGSLVRTVLTLCTQMQGNILVGWSTSSIFDSNYLLRTFIAIGGSDNEMYK